MFAVGLWWELEDLRVSLICCFEDEGAPRSWSGRSRSRSRSRFDDPEVWPSFLMLVTRGTAGLVVPLDRFDGGDGVRPSDDPDEVRVLRLILAGFLSSGSFLILIGTLFAPVEAAARPLSRFCNEAVLALPVLLRETILEVVGRRPPGPEAAAAPPGGEPAPFSFLITPPVGRLV